MSAPKARLDYNYTNVSNRQQGTELLKKVLDFLTTLSLVNLLQVVLLYCLQGDNSVEIRCFVRKGKSNESDF